ncbi:la-related protein 1C-like [Dendrobium catenatum]|uniref:HTH La-type RNA-binding domain-containing protein n=1 Tax=Dendrobium catenatum TaxID=906689 RepID=A0A2I0WE31_9ASPA|nr:la-related protein 1C-like [Dendrobium catenatum]PKU73917.1 hypothetical protein MA16_Dca024544 [Dendrobium catenatum]
MSSEDHSTSSSSAIGNDNATAKGNQLAALGRAFNEEVEADPSIVSRPVNLPRGNHSASSSVRRNYNAPTERVAWRRIPSNEVRSPNRNIGRLNNNHGTFNIETSPYRAPNFTAPHIDFGQPNLHAYGTVPPPTFPVPFFGNPEPSTSSSAQGLNNVFPYAPHCAYYHPTHPHVGYFIPLQDINAAQQSKIFSWLYNMRTRLRKQIEYYFSSGNLETDIFLKRQMDANGWVPISLIAGFRRVETLMKEANLVYNYLRSYSFMLDYIAPLTSDEQFISDSMEFSGNVEVQGDKIRKRRDWEKWVLPQNPTLSNAESAN